MDKITKYVFGIIILLFVFTNNNFASKLNIECNYNTPADSVNILEQYSLFSEYYKNKDFDSALRNLKDAGYGVTIVVTNENTD